MLQVIFYNNQTNNNNMKIETVKLGLPTKDGVELSVAILGFATDATTAGVYYKVMSEESETLADGNIQLTEAEFEEWGADNAFVEDIVLAELGLVRKAE